MDLALSLGIWAEDLFWRAEHERVMIGSPAEGGQALREPPGSWLWADVGHLETGDNRAR